MKGGAALEELGRVNVLAFDKTGTLTENGMRLAEIRPVEQAPPVSPELVLAALAALGGFEIATLTGALLQAASVSRPASETAVVLENEVNMVDRKRRSVSSDGNAL